MLQLIAVLNIVLIQNYSCMALRTILIYYFYLKFLSKYLWTINVYPEYVIIEYYDMITKLQFIFIHCYNCYYNCIIVHILN